MPTGMQHVAAAALLWSAMSGCGGPYCPQGYDQIDDKCYRRKDGGAAEDASHGDAHDAGEGEGDEEETGTDADVGDERADAGDEETDAGNEGEDASVPSLGDAGMPCVPAVEICDGKDNDCDGRADEDTPTWYCDDDEDGFAANTQSKLESCNKPAASNSCRGWTTKAPSGPNAQDCDDKSARRFPGAGFGLATGSNGDLNCDGQTEIRLEFVDETAPIDFFSSATRFNICEFSGSETVGSSDASTCGCWFATVLVKDFLRFDEHGVAFGRSGDCCAVVPYSMPTFPCSEQLGDVILLSRATMIDGQCTQELGGVAVRQLCR